MIPLMWIASANLYRDTEINCTRILNVLQIKGSAMILALGLKIRSHLEKQKKQRQNKTFVFYLKKKIK